MRRSRYFLLAAIFAASLSSAQAPAGREAAKAALDAACRVADCSNARGVHEAAARVDDGLRACGASCGKPVLARLKVALSYAMSTWTAADAGGVDTEPVIRHAVKLDEALDARARFSAADLAQAESEWLCAEKRPACARVRRANEGLALLSGGLAQCGRGECPPETLASMCRGAVDAKDYAISDDVDQMPGSYALARLKELSGPLEAVTAKKLGPGLDASEVALAGVDRALDGAAAGRADAESPDALSGWLETAQAQWRQGSQAVNFCAAETPSVERMNAVARGLRSAHARLKALRVARGLAADPKPEEGGAVLARGGQERPASNGAAAVQPRRRNADALALSSSLQPPAKVVEPASLLTRAEGVPAPSDEDAAELKRIQGLREKGKTRIVGDPAGRGALVHAQTGQDCVIVSQQQILVMAGLVGNADPAGTEEALQREANAKGYHDQEWGTLPEHYGSLLMDRGFLVARADAAGLERLDAAVKTGRPVIVSVDARRLWDQPSQDVISHAIIITGALSDPSTGKLLGYYVNDSAEPPAGARFITAKTFGEMWQAAGGKMMEVL